MVLRTAVLAAVLLAGTAAAPEPNATEANAAFVDPATTADMAGQAKAEVQAVLSYTWSDVDAWKAAVQRYTTGYAATVLQNQLAATLPTITQQQATATTTVVDLGVRRLTSHDAEVLAFVNTSTARPSGNPVVTGSAVVVKLERLPQGWLISDLQVPR